MITHAALTLHELRPEHPELRRGMPMARCGYENDGHGIAVAWERRFIDCPMCLFELDNVTVIHGLGDRLRASTQPGTELPMRKPKRPDYVPEGHIYTPPEFRPRERRLNLLQAILLWVMVLAAILTVVAVCFVYTDNVGTGPGPASTPITYGPPPYTHGR